MENWSNQQTFFTGLRCRQSFVIELSETEWIGQVLVLALKGLHAGEPLLSGLFPW